MLSLLSGGSQAQLMLHYGDPLRAFYPAFLGSHSTSILMPPALRVRELANTRRVLESFLLSDDLVQHDSIARAQPLRFLTHIDR